MRIRNFNIRFIFCAIVVILNNENVCLPAAVLPLFSSLFVYVGEVSSNIFSSSLLSHLFFLSFLMSTLPLRVYYRAFAARKSESIRFISRLTSFRFSVILIEFQQWKSKTVLFCLHQNPCLSVIRIKCAIR